MSTTGTPRDVKILHLILASMGVNAYQDTVPLQLMDFAHRYTVGILSDAVAYNDYAHASAATQPAGFNASNEPLTVEDIRLAVSLRVNQQFKPAAPKGVLLELAQERNARPLPSVPNGHGLRLPPEKHCLTGRNRSFDYDDDITISGAVPLDLDALAAGNSNPKPAEDEAEAESEKEANPINTEDNDDDDDDEEEMEAVEMDDTAPSDIPEQPNGETVKTEAEETTQEAQDAEKHETDDADRMEED